MKTHFKVTHRESHHDNSDNDLGLELYHLCHSSFRLSRAVIWIELLVQVAYLCVFMENLSLFRVLKEGYGQPQPESMAE